MKIMRAVRITPGIHLLGDSFYHFEFTTNTTMNRVDLAYTDAPSQPDCYQRINSGSWNLTQNQISYRFYNNSILGPNHTTSDGFLNFGVNLGDGIKHEWAQAFQTSDPIRVNRLELYVKYLINGGLNGEVSLRIVTGSIPNQGDVVFEKDGLSLTKTGWCEINI